jgi:hypothetical protein
MLYDKNGIEVQYSTIEKHRQLCGTEVPAVLLEAISQTGKKIKVMYPEEPMFDEKDTHITVNPGVHLPQFMRSVVYALREGRQEITLGNETYNLATASKTKTTYTYLDVFCL